MVQNKIVLSAVIINILDRSKEIGIIHYQCLIYISRITSYCVEQIWIALHNKIANSLDTLSIKAITINTYRRSFASPFMLLQIKPVYLHHNPSNIIKRNIQRNMIITHTKHIVTIQSSTKGWHSLFLHVLWAIEIIVLTALWNITVLIQVKIRNVILYYTHQHYI